MTPKPKAYAPAMSDAAVEAKTGRNWQAWFALLDAAGASKLDHKATARMLAAKYAVPGWWSQMLTVEYERARGLRVKHQTQSGFSVAVSRTVAASLSDLYAATASEARRKRWFPRGTFALSSQTKDKYFRGSWSRGARLEMGFYARGAGKSQIAIQVNKLPKQSDVELQRRAWQAALSKLQNLLEA